MKKIFFYALLFNGLALANEANQTTEQGMSGATIAHHAEFWADKLPPLSTQETHLLANFLYFSYLNSRAESATRIALIMVHAHTILMNKQLATHEQDAKTTALNAANLLKEIKEELLPLRAYAGKAWLSCMQEIEKSSYTTLKTIVSNLQTYGKEVITQFIKQDQPSIQKLIQNSITALDTTLQNLQFCNGVLKSILDHKNPYLKEGDPEEVVNLDVTLGAADKILASLMETSLAFTDIKQMSVDMLNISQFIFHNFYAALCTKITGSIPIMFDENGLIAPESIDEYLSPLLEKMTISKKHYSA